LLLAALVQGARRRGLPALSLSVEPDDPAVALCQRLGFSAIDHPDGAITMILRLA
jgi:hypothetical protein